MSSEQRIAKAMIALTGAAVELLLLGLTEQAVGVLGNAPPCAKQRKMRSAQMLMLKTKSEKRCCRTCVCDAGGGQDQADHLLQAKTWSGELNPQTRGTHTQQAG
jgi:hypothetical protein